MKYATDCDADLIVMGTYGRGLVAHVVFGSVAAQFVTVPGLCLTVHQAARLLSVREPDARALLDALVDERLLVHLDDTYRRVLG